MRACYRLALLAMLGVAPAAALAQAPTPLVGRGMSGPTENWDASAPSPAPQPVSPTPAAKAGFFSKLFKKPAPASAEAAKAPPPPPPPAKEASKAPMPLSPPDPKPKATPPQPPSGTAATRPVDPPPAGTVRTELARIEAAKAGLVFNDRASPIVVGTDASLPRVPVPKAKPWASAPPTVIASVEKPGPVQEMPPAEILSSVSRPAAIESKPLPVVVIVPGPPPEAIDDFYVGSIARREGPLPSLAKEMAARKTLNDGTPPYQRVRALQVLQDKIATGSTEALQAERRMRAEMDAVFPELDAATWQDPRNANALVAYVLSGGFPEVVRRIARLDPPPAVDRRLLDGALAYLDGREKEAAQALDGIEARQLDASIGAQVAMAQAALAVKTDAGKAILLLDTARLLAPGTLVEEAALRREVFMTGQTGDHVRFEALARQYLDRFRHSVYAGNFRYRFVAALTQSHYLDDAGKFAGLEKMLENVEPVARREVYLAIARSAAFQAKPAGGSLAAARAERLADAGSPEAASARLYMAAAHAVTPGNAREAAETLAKIDRRVLPASDRGLFDAVRLTIDLVLDATKAVETADLSKVAGEPPVQTESMKKAGQALDAADAVLANPRFEIKS